MKTLSMKTGMAALFIITLLLVGGLMLSGCGSGTKDEPEAAPDDGSYSLVNEGQLTVAASLDFPPFESLDGETPTGFAVELMQLLADEMGLECTYLPTVKFDSIIPMISAGGKADVGVSSFTISAERAKEIDFVDPYFDSNQGIVVSADSTAQSALDLQGKTIGAQSGTTGYDWAVENIPGANVVAYDEMTAIFAALDAGQIDGIVADLPVVDHYIKTAYTQDVVIEQVPTGEQYGMVVSQDNPGLTAELNKALATLHANGSYDQLYDKYFG